VQSRSGRLMPLLCCPLCQENAKGELTARSQAHSTLPDKRLDNYPGQLKFRPPDCRRPESVTTAWIFSGSRFDHPFAIFTVVES
ncbi:hypothetical protein ACTVJH_14815, partial [Desulfoplanes sp. PS50]